jgi:hypothetical protein
MSQEKKESKWNSSPFFYLNDMKFYRVMLKNFILTLLVFILKSRRFIAMLVSQRPLIRINSSASR